MDGLWYRVGSRLEAKSTSFFILFLNYTRTSILRLREYVRKRNSNSYRKYVLSADQLGKCRILIRLIDLNVSSMKWSKKSPWRHLLNEVEQEHKIVYKEMLHI